jgi:lipoate-protein ligase A
MKPPLDINDFRYKIIDGLAHVFGEMNEWALSGEDWVGIHRLAREKYQSWGWIYGHSPEFIVRYPFRSNSHKVNARIRVNRGLIKSIYPEDGEIYATMISRLIGKPYIPHILTVKGLNGSNL